MTAFAKPPFRPSEAPGSGIVRFGSAVGVGVAAAFVCTVPATIRVAAAVANTEGPPLVWSALAAAALGPMIAAVIVLRGAREGLRTYAGPGAVLRACGVGLWLASLLVAFALFGSVLRATTHQHALAGVTFAFGAVALAAASALVCARGVAILGNASAAARYTAVVLLPFIAFLALSWVGIRFLHAIAQDPASAAAGSTVVDVLAFTLAAFFAAGSSLSFQRTLALMGPPLAIVVAAIGVTTLRDAPLREAIDERAPAFGPAVDWVP
jgi:hypothetical protein